MNSAIVHLYSKVYLPEDDESWSARPSGGLLRWIHQHLEEESARWILSFDGRDVRIGLGDPVAASVDSTEYSLYLPQWLLQSMGLEGSGEELRVSFQRSEALEKATHIKFKVLGDLLEGFDLREVMEAPLSQLGVLSVGQILPVPVLEGVNLLVEECAPPGEFVLLDGNEIGLEIETEAALPPVPARVPTPVPSVPETLEDFSMLPTVPAPAARGSKSAFVPFSGAGRRLRD